MNAFGASMLLLSRGCSRRMLGCFHRASPAMCWSQCSLTKPRHSERNARSPPNLDCSCAWSSDGICVTRIIRRLSDLYTSRGLRFGKPRPGKNIGDDFVHGAALLSTLARCTVGVNILPLRAHLVNAGGSDAERHVCRDSIDPSKNGRKAVHVHRIDEQAEDGAGEQGSRVRKCDISRTSLSAMGLRSAPIEGVRRCVAHTNR